MISVPTINSIMITKTGWPWTEETPSDTYDPSIDWPTISIITPSYNQGAYIEETIRSIILQNYPKLEYIIIDGGSTDQTVDIIKAYEPWISYWVSEPDKGQADALNKGIAKSTGSIINWINSDDLLTKGAMKEIAEAFLDTQCDIFAGGVENFSDTQLEVHIPNDITAERIYMFNQCSWHQPGTWIKGDLFKKIIPLEETLHYGFDTRMMEKMLENSVIIAYGKNILARFRLHENSKTVGSSASFDRELESLRDAFFKGKTVYQFYLKEKKRREALFLAIFIYNSTQYSASKKMQKLLFLAAQNFQNFKVLKFVFGAMKKLLWS